MVGRVLLLFVAACKTMGDVPPAVSEWIPFDKSAGTVRFDVTINGVPARGILSTGSVDSIISPEFAAKHDIGVGGRGELVARGAFGTKNVDTADDFTVAFKTAQGGVRVQHALLLEPSPNCDLSLGLRFFYGLVLQIDYPSSRFRYMTRGASTLAEQANTKVKSEPGTGRLLVEVEVNGRHHWVVLNTATSGPLYLSRRTATEGGWLSNAKPAGSKTVPGLVKPVELELFVLDMMKIGPFELEEVPLAVQNRIDGHKTQTSPKLGSRTVPSRAARPGSLGYDVLKHFVVTLDLEQALLHLQSP